MHPLGSFRTRLLRPVFLCVLVSLLVLAACSRPPFDRGAPPSATTSPNPVTATSEPETATPAGSTHTPEETPTSTRTGETETPQATPTDQTPTGTASPTIPPGYVVNGPGNSTIEQAHAQLQSQGDPVYLIVVSSQSTGIQADIYRDLRQRLFRTTTGPDEGIDTSSEFCYPNCVYVLSEVVNVNSVDSWIRVLQHEYRHIAQAKNNSSLARDFRDPNGTFTSYGAFLEACADYGLNVAAVYRAQPRMDQLKRVLGSDQQGLIDQACTGYKFAYQSLVDQYNQKLGQNGAFEQLLPPYR